MKKIISILLVAVLVLLMTVSVFAGSEAELAATELSRYEIMCCNSDGNLHLDDAVTRAEMAKMIMIMTGHNSISAASTFTDVPTDHWAYDYIAQAASKGVINGMGDGTFVPDEFVTYAQASKMIVCALGYGAEAERRGKYPIGYIMTATTLGIMPQKADMSAFANRGDIAIMLALALDVPIMVEVESEDRVSNKVLYSDDGIDFVTLRTFLEK